MHRTNASLLCSAVALALAGHAFVGQAHAAVLDPDWTESTFSTNTGGGGHTGLAWAPDGSDRLFVLEKTGRVRVLSGATTTSTPTWTTFATMSPIHTNSECGLIGMAFDPDFAVTQYVYFFVTVSASEQQILRYDASGDVGTDRTVIRAGLPTIGQNHDGGAIGFGPDGKLYFAIGDLGNGTGIDADLVSLASKVGRVHREDGSPVNDNPFFDGVGPNNESIWARGFRNPFTMTFQPATGQLWLNVVGTSYEQVFVVTRASHGGYNDYENNQPALAPYLRPVITYRTNGTDSRTITGAERSANIATFTTTTPHRLRVGGEVTISGVADVSFNTTAYVASTPDDTTFTIEQNGPDATLENPGGTMQTTHLGGSLTGGTFYDATLAPAEYRGNFFFGDFNSGNIMRSTLDAGTNTVRSVAVWGQGLGGLVDIAPGPDGALYYVRNNGNLIYRAAYNADAQSLVVSNQNIRMEEGGKAVLTVSLTLEPDAPVTVNVARVSGDSDVGVMAASTTLTFTPEDWSVPQIVWLTAAPDEDTAEDEAVVRTSADGLDNVDTSVRVTDRLVPSTFIFGDGFEP